MFVSCNYKTQSEGSSVMIGDEGMRAAVPIATRGNNRAELPDSSPLQLRAALAGVGQSRCPRVS